MARVASAEGSTSAAAGPIYEVRLEVRQDSGTTAQPPRHYTLRIDPLHKGVFEVGNRDPASSVEVGAKIECALTGSEEQIRLKGSISLGQIVETRSMGSRSEPIVAQRKLAFEKTVELGAPVMIGSNGDLQVEAIVSLLQVP